MIFSKRWFCRGGMPRLVLCGTFAGIGGCGAGGALLSKVMPDPVVPAKYVPQHDNMLVLVENYQNPATITEAAEQMDRQIAETLVAHKVAPLVNPDLLTQLRTDHPDKYRKLEIPALGRALGARQVLYANVIQFATEPAVGSQMLKAHAEARVRIVDSKSGETRWPQDTAGGYPVSVDLPFRPTGDGVDEGYIREALARELSSRISKLFYDVSVDQVDGTEPPMDLPQEGIHGKL
jgi:hypothetical protein